MDDESQRNLELSRRAIDAWNANDWETLEALNDAAIVMCAPDGWPEPGESHGWPAVRAQIERLKDSWADEHYEAEVIEARGERVLVGGRWRGHGGASGLTLDLATWFVNTCRGGRVVRTDYFLDEEQARRSFTSD